jgi:FkbM family methyltransferase
MGLGERVIATVHRYQEWRKRRTPGTIGAFWRAGGNVMLWSDIPVSSDTVVVDAGGFEGSWTKEMLMRYGCRALILEPVPDYARHLRDLFGRNDRVEVVQGALFGHDGEAAIGVGAESSGVFLGTADSTVTVPLLDVARVFRERNLTEVACLKLNVEGSEYDILDRLIEAGLMRQVRSLVVQFHQNVPNHAARRAAIQRSLALTHEKRFDFAFVWECWIRRKAAGPAGNVP